MKIRLDEKVINDGPMNLEPDFVRRIALNIRKGAKFSIEQEGSQIWTYMQPNYAFWGQNYLYSSKWHKLKNVLLFPGPSSETNEDSGTLTATPSTSSKRYVKRKDLVYCPVDNSAKFLRRKRLSPVLSSICGEKTFLYKQEVVTAVLSYIKKHKLQKGKLEIICDEKLELLTKKKKVTLLDVMARLDKNMS